MSARPEIHSAFTPLLLKSRCLILIILILARERHAKLQQRITHRHQYSPSYLYTDPRQPPKTAIVLATVTVRWPEDCRHQTP